LSVYLDKKFFTDNDKPTMDRWLSLSHRKYVVSNLRMTSSCRIFYKSIGRTVYIRQSGSHRIALCSCPYKELPIREYCSTMCVIPVTWCLMIYSGAGTRHHVTLMSSSHAIGSCVGAADRVYNECTGCNVTLILYTIWKPGSDIRK
jgi:hypothetical protein